MSKVIQSFYCLVEEKTYSKGDNYEGNRGDKLIALGYIDGKATKKDKKADGVTE